MATGLDVPWGIAFLPDGSALVSERDTARIVHVTPQGAVTEVGTGPGSRRQRRGRAARASRSPRRTRQDRTLFAYFTAGPENVIARMTYDGSGLADQRRIFGGIPSGPIHNGGRIAFGPDGFLYVGTGEAGRRTPAQDPNDLGGKILRITPDGDPAPGNPFDGLAGLDPRPPQRAGPGVGRARPDVGQRVRPEHLGRAEPDRAGRQLRLAGGRGTRGRRAVPQPGAAVAHRRGLAERHRDRRRRRCAWPALRGERLWQIPLLGSTGPGSRGRC